jgi:uncharacterized repeat protein (TIGR01451 family)
MNQKIKVLLAIASGLCLVMAILFFLNPTQILASSPEGWQGSMYWKDGGWIDYASNGVPDFDQKQDNWYIGTAEDPHWTYCGPVAAANSLWLFDSKFEPKPFPPPLPPNDNYYLVTAYQPAIDDHDPSNVGGMGSPGLVDDLACYFQTDQVGSGTEVHNLAVGLQEYLYNDPTHKCYQPNRSRGGSFYDDYYVQLVKKPTWEWVVDEVERSEDVILLLGFWQDYVPDPSYDEWVRLGGHYVTVAGIDSTLQQIAFSDPYLDNAELGGPGRVLSGTIFIPHTPGHPAMIHNDAGNISHDIYTVNLVPTSPAGAWEINGYPYLPNLVHQNIPSEFIPQDGEPSAEPQPIYVEVEYAVAMSPFDWKPGGEWVDVPWLGEWYTEWWRYKDDGDSCLPDFGWWDGASWYDGPTALANSLWWFDSKAETLVTGDNTFEPPTISDHYNLLTSYDPGWDDHDPKNTLPFIQDLASYIYINSIVSGTLPADMASGVADYLITQGVMSDFYTHTMDSPTFEWVADEVETCEDVLLLLGFYENIGENVWERKGGHWVNAAGISRQNKQIGLSDPWIDRANIDSFFDVVYTGRVFPPDQLGTDFTNDEKLEPQNISHDIYQVSTDGIPLGGQFALMDYPATDVITDFIELNGGGNYWTHKPISTVVEWALSVSPYSDLVITKTTPLTEVTPGAAVTYTLQYANLGLAAAQSVRITDTIPTYLENVSYSAFPPLTSSPGITYAWSLPLLSYGQGGTITITGDSTIMVPPYNEVVITGTSSIGDVTPDRNNGNNRDHAGRFLLYLPCVMR